MLLKPSNFIRWKSSPRRLRPVHCSCAVACTESIKRARNKRIDVFVLFFSDLICRVLNKIGAGEEEEEDCRQQRIMSSSRAANTFPSSQRIFYLRLPVEICKNVLMEIFKIHKKSACISRTSRSIPQMLLRPLVLTNETRLRLD